MSIAIFLGTLGTRAGGMETYETQFVRALAEQDRTQSYHIFCLRHEARGLLAIRQPNFRFTMLPGRIRMINVSVIMPALLSLSKARLVHPTYIPPLFCRRPIVYTVHSSVTWAHPEFFPRWIRWRLNWLQEKGLREARVLVCVSEHVKAFVSERFGVPLERMAVVYHGVSPEFRVRRAEEVRPVLKARYGIDYPYLLFVGKITANKNIHRLLQAFAQFRHATGGQIRLVLAGRRLWSEGELDRQVDQAVARGGIVELGHVAHEDLPLLYNGSEGLVFPSLWEGFGLPILEAFASGVPVLTANNSSLPEVSAGHAILVNELCVEDIAHGMCRMIQDRGLRERLIQGGLLRAKEFTWQRTAAQMQAVYARTLAECSR